MHTKFWSETSKGRDHAEDVGVYGKIILKWMLGTHGVEMWTVFTWLIIGTSDGLL